VIGLANGWTGGQYSVFRAVFGLYLATHFAQLLPWGGELFSNRGMLPDADASPLYPLFPNLLFAWDPPAAVTLLLLAGIALAVCLALGVADRVAAVALWWIWACLFTRNPLIANPSLPFVGWLLLAHACIPREPYGSFAARGRTDPRGDWALPAAIFAAAWIVMAVGYSYSGYTKLVSPSWREGTAIARVLENPLARDVPLRTLLLSLPESLVHVWTWGALALELLFAPLALFARARPWLWLALLGMHVSLVALIDFADLSMGMVMLHLFTVDPAWIPPRRDTRPLRLFYDGGCGLCHRAVRFLLAEDRDGRGFRFAPLASDAFERSVPPEIRAELPDSLVLVTPDGRVSTRSAALLEAGAALGGLWRLLAAAARVIPRRLLDRGYDFIARMRTRMFRKPDDACPLLPPDLRARFD
jgi:predicted DCC family thiol-disulfide oxidoreductase YuxK